MQRTEERLQKLLAHAGIASRRKAEELILAGRVSVNGATVTELGTKADWSVDQIKVDGQIISRPKHYTYLAFHKPKNVVSTVHDPQGRETVLSFFKGFKERIYPVGRLDYASEGLLLLTNDGEFANRLLSPSSHIIKTYLAKATGSLDDAQEEEFRAGIPMHGKRTAPAGLKLIRPGQNPWYEVRLVEGRQNQIRIMFKHFGLLVEKLKRVKVAFLEIGDLKAGAYRTLTRTELAHFQKLLGLGELDSGEMAASAAVRSIVRSGTNSAQGDRKTPRSKFSKSPSRRASEDSRATVSRPRKLPPETGTGGDPERRGAERPDRTRWTSPEPRGSVRPPYRNEDRPMRGTADAPQRRTANRSPRQTPDRAARRGPAGSDRAGTNRDRSERPERLGSVRPPYRNEDRPMRGTADAPPRRNPDRAAKQIADRPAQQNAGRPARRGPTGSDRAGFNRPGLNQSGLNQSGSNQARSDRPERRGSGRQDRAAPGKKRGFDNRDRKGSRHDE